MTVGKYAQRKSLVDLYISEPWVNVKSFSNQERSVQWFDPS